MDEHVQATHALLITIRIGAGGPSSHRRRGDVFGLTSSLTLRRSDGALGAGPGSWSRTRASSPHACSLLTLSAAPTETAMLIVGAGTSAASENN
jgi:hypothetical protein